MNSKIFEETVHAKVSFSKFDLSRESKLTTTFGRLTPCFVQEVLPNDRFTLKVSQVAQFAPMVAPMMQRVYIGYHFFFVPNRLAYNYWEQAITGSDEGEVLSDSEIPDMPYMNMYNILGRFASLTEYDYSPGSVPNPDDYKGFDDYEDYFRFINSNPFRAGGLLDYLGYPVVDFRWRLTSSGSYLSPFGSRYFNSLSGERISDLPLRAFWLIWKDYYRDENLQNEVPGVSVGDLGDIKKQLRLWRDNAEYLEILLGDNGDTFDYKLQQFWLECPYRSWRKDYFTAALLSPQKGDEVTIPLLGTAPVSTNPSGSIPTMPVVARPNSTDSQNAVLYVPSGSQVNQPVDIKSGVTGDNGIYVSASDLVITLGALNLEADLTGVSTITINQLRELSAMQQVLERLARVGSRYVEYLKGFFGVAPLDATLQRPQFLGGWTSYVNVEPVLQQSGFGANQSNEAFNMTGYAAGRAVDHINDGFIFKETFYEYGYIIGIMSVMPVAAYSQGLPRHLTRMDRFDYFLPQFAFLGEQGIKNKELCLVLNNSVNDVNNQIFGYIPRWTEYRTSFDEIHGEFRTSLDFFHMARKFNQTTPVSLDANFISTKSVEPRPFALWSDYNKETVTGGITDLVWLDLYFDVKADRPLPYNAIPRLT